MPNSFRPQRSTAADTSARQFLAQRRLVSISSRPVFIWRMSWAFQPHQSCRKAMFVPFLRQTQIDESAPQMVACRRDRLPKRVNHSPEISCKQKFLIGTLSGFRVSRDEDHQPSMYSNTSSRRCSVETPQLEILSRSRRMSALKVNHEPCLLRDCRFFPQTLPDGAHVPPVGRFVIKPLRVRTNPTGEVQTCKFVVISWILHERRNVCLVRNSVS